MRFKLWFDKAFELARDLGVLAATTCSAKKRKLEKQLADMLTTPTDCDLAAKLQAKIGRARAQLLTFCDYPGQVEPSRVDDWRGGGESRGVAVFRRLSPIAGASVRSFAPFPVAARQTVQAGFPHTAFTPSIRPSLSAGQCAARGFGAARAFHAGSPARFAQSRVRFYRRASSTSVAVDDRRICGSGHRFP